MSRCLHILHQFFVKSDFWPPQTLWRTTQ